MGLVGFQIWPVSGPEILDGTGLNGPKLLQHPSEIVGREAAHHFGLVLKPLRAVQTRKIHDFRHRNWPDLKTKQSHSQTYETLECSARVAEQAPGPRR